VLDALGAGPLSAEAALARGLIDVVAYRDQLEEQLEAQMGGKLRRVPLGSYARWSRWLADRPRIQRGEPAVAVVHMEGPIVQGGGVAMGRRGARVVADDVIPVLDALAEDTSIGAVVLRISSPGGSAVASDLIARSVQRLTRSKPVVASFGDVSASGGYYLSAPATEIVAHPGSITGSIGVVGGKLVVGPALGRMGVHIGNIQVGPGVGMFSPWRPFDADERDRYRATLQRIYARFLAVVAAGRKQPVEAIEEVAAGRVWTGRQAMEHGLVDRLGGVDVAIDVARTRASLSARGAVHHLRVGAGPIAALTGFLTQAIAAEVGLEAPRGLGLWLGWLRRAPGTALTLLPWGLDDI
jgi:protease-4